MAPGYYDAVMAACRTGGFEPEIDQHGAGSTVWGYIADGRGVGLVVSSLIEQLPRGVFDPGDLVLVTDTTGRGHVTFARGEPPLEALFIPEG